MTVPYLMNCSHSKTGWCLGCVKAEQAKKDSLVKAAKEAMRCLTGEKEKAWEESQSYDEAPYHFLYVAIKAASA